MTQEDKQLLLKDLSARLPYGVKVSYSYFYEMTIKSINVYHITAELVNEGHKFAAVPIEDFKPYLRPMSSMTEEEREEYSSFVLRESDGYLTDGLPDYTGKHYVYIDNVNVFINWLLKNHFDYCGLIEKGLAIEVTKENNPYEN